MSWFGIQMDYVAKGHQKSQGISRHDIPKFWGPFHQWYFHGNSNLMETFTFNSIVGYHTATKFCSCHDSTAVMQCAKFHSNFFTTTWMGAEWNFRQIWITIDNLFVKWAPERCKLMIGCYHVCSCPGEVRSQGSSRHAIDWITKNILVLGVLSVNHLNLCTFPVGSGAVRPHVSGSGFVFHCCPPWSEDRYTSERTHMFKSKWKHFPHSLRNYFQFKWISIRIIMFKICVWHTWSQNKVVVS